MKLIFVEVARGSSRQPKLSHQQQEQQEPSLENHLAWFCLNILSEVESFGAVHLLLSMIQFSSRLKIFTLQKPSSQVPFFGSRLWNMKLSSGEH